MGSDHGRVVSGGGDLFVWYLVSCSRISSAKDLVVLLGSNRPCSCVIFSVGQLNLKSPSGVMERAKSGLVGWGISSTWPVGAISRSGLIGDILVVKRARWHPGARRRPVGGCDLLGLFWAAPSLRNLWTYLSTAAGPFVVLKTADFDCQAGRHCTEYS